MNDNLLDQSNRENWGTRTGFVLAAIGSAVGLGNLWGFPYKVYSHGGGAFLIPYLIAMLFIGIPLLILEFSLGHMTQKSAPDAFRGINRKTETVGWWGIILGFIIITYYPVILAWCGNYLYECVRSIATDSPLPWAGEGAQGVANAKSHFFNSFLQFLPASDDQATSSAAMELVKPILISLVIIWVFMYLCIFRGVKLVGKIVLWTVPLPWIMLMILMVRGLTLPGAGQGLNFYLTPDFAKLAEPETWKWAFGQMFFSMSLAFGVMITYASFLHRKSDINNNSAIIGLADIGTSFFAGIAVFATLGAMAFATQHAALVSQNPDLALDVQNVVDGGPSLAFVAFPYALAQLPHAAWFGVIFFIALLTLGIDSAFSITESVLTAIVDKTGWNRGKTLIGMTVVGFGCSLIYCTRGGLNWIGSIDEFINSTWGGICFLGLLECVVIGWAYRIGRLREHANERSDWKLGIWWEWIIRYFAPIVLSALFAWSLIDKLSGQFLLDDKGEIILTMLVGLIVVIAAPILSLILSLIKSQGADIHAQHVGQPRLGRIRGTLATSLVIISAALLGYTCYLMATPAGPVGLDVWETAKTWKEITIPNAAWVFFISTAISLLSVAVGGFCVHRSEAIKKRPSGMARFGAGMGTMLIGGNLGLALYAIIEKNPTAGQVAQKATKPASEILEGGGTIVLAIMLGILIIGLGWCFYRAIKAGTTETLETQLSEGANNNG